MDGHAKLTGVRAEIFVLLRPWWGEKLFDLDIRGKIWPKM